MLRFLTSFAILALNFRHGPAADSRLAAVACPPASGWETTVTSGNSLGWNFKAPVAYWGYTPLLSAWDAALLADEPEVPSLGYLKLNEQRLFYYTHFPKLLRGGWVAEDLVNKSLVYRHADGKEHFHFQADGTVAVSIYRNESDVPAPALFFWKIDVDGCLLFANDGLLEAPHSIERLLQRHGQKLVIDSNGQKIEMEYLQRRKK